MVYTKHKVVHSFKQLHSTDGYIKNNAKTIIPSETQLINSLDYIVQDIKTDGKKLVSGHMVGDLDNSYDEFINTKMIAELGKARYLKFDDNGTPLPPTLEDIERGNKNGNAVLAHHLIQSFSPDDDLTPEQVHEIGRQTIMELTGGDYQFVIATHVDQGHLHNHIIFNSTNSLTGNTFRWQKGTKQDFENISDKIASRYGAKIIEKSPQGSHAQYTKWQANNIFKKKIKDRLDFLLANSSSKTDFLEKAKALSLEVNSQGKHTKFRLSDTNQEQWTRARTLDKKNPEKYQMDSIEEFVDNNDLSIGVDEVVAEYFDSVNADTQDFTYQIEIEPWQIDSTNNLGIYINVDFGSDRHGQVFIHGNYLDQLANGNYAFFLKDNDFFPLTSDDNLNPGIAEDKNNKKFIKGRTLLKTISVENKHRPVRKEPVMKSMQDYVRALDFYAKNGDGTLQSGQSKRIEQNLQASLIEAKTKLRELDEKIIELRQEMANHLDDPKAIAGFKVEQDAIKASRDLLQEQYEEVVDNLDYYEGVVRVVNDKPDEKPKKQKR